MSESRRGGPTPHRVTTETCPRTHAGTAFATARALVWCQRPFPEARRCRQRKQTCRASRTFTRRQRLRALRDLPSSGRRWAEWRAGMSEPARPFCAANWLPRRVTAELSRERRIAPFQVRGFSLRSLHSKSGQSCLSVFSRLAARCGRLSTDRCTNTSHSFSQRHSCCSRSRPDPWWRRSVRSRRTAGPRSSSPTRFSPRPCTRP